MMVEYLLTVAGSAAMTFVLIALGLPYIRQFALALPNARSSHKAPTPQGGGIAVIATTVVVVALAVLLQATLGKAANELAWMLAATVLLATVGIIDDFRTLHVAPRLVLQVVAV